MGGCECVSVWVSFGVILWVVGCEMLECSGTVTVLVLFVLLLLLLLLTVMILLWMLIMDGAESSELPAGQSAA